MKHFDKIYCINLDSRPDRWEECLVEFRKLGIENIVERFPAHTVPGVDGIAGCTKSHTEIIKLAKSRGEKNILIFEDDFESVRDTVWEDLDRTMEQISKNNLSYDMLFLGGRIVGKPGEGAEFVDDNLLRIFKVKTVHAYIVNEQIYDYIIDSFRDINWTNPRLWVTQNPDRMSVDVWYMNNIQSQGNTYGIYPAVFQQRASYSDLIGRTGGTAFWNVDDSWNKSKNIKERV